MAVTFDHIAVSAETRADGRSAFQAMTGVELPLGGEHPLMGTHNCVSAMGSDQFLELITIDPDAPTPSQKRWFALDDIRRNRLAAHAVVLRSDDLDGDLEDAKSLGVDLGVPLALSRGNLAWRFAVREDGAIPLDGAAPMLMQWNQPTPHPASKMQDQGIRLNGIKITTPHAKKLSKLYEKLGWSGIEICEGKTQLSFELSINGTQVML